MNPISNPNILQSIVSTLSNHDALSMSNLSEMTGLSIPTVTKYVNILLDRGVAKTVLNEADEQRGRKSRMISISGESAFFVGVDINHSSTQMALADASGKILAEKEYALPFSNTPENMENVCSRIEEFIEESCADDGKVALVAVNLSGRVNHVTGYSYSVFNFEQHDEPVADVLTERLGRKTIIDNDTRAMAYGELNTTLSDKYRNFIFVNASWGIGLSIIIEGKIYCGMNGYSGEIGHTHVYDNEIMCHCGKKGCLETVVSGRALCMQLKTHLANGETSILGKDPEKIASLSEMDIIYAANHDDPLSIELLEKTGSELGRQIANLINIFNPQAVVIGGTMSLAGDLFLQPIRMAVRRYSLKLILKDVDIISSTLGRRAGVIGACLKARDEYFSRIYEMTVSPE